jgi:hypothetical protein
MFEQLDPPPGGTERFRRRLDQSAPQSHGLRWRAAVAGMAALVLVTAAPLLLRDVERGERTTEAARADARVATVYEAQQFDRLLGRRFEPSEPAVTLNEEAATISEVDTTNDKVRIYQID